MNTLSKTKEINFLGTKYRFTKYFNPKLLRIERYEVIGTFGRKGWKEIYFGHSNPIEECVDFFRSTEDISEKEDPMTVLLVDKKVTGITFNGKPLRKIMDGVYEFIKKDK